MRIEVRRCLIGLAMVGLLAPVIACQETTDDGFSDVAFDRDVLYGDGTNPGSPVICKVGDFKITQRDLDQRREELNKEELRLFSGPNGDRLLLRQMVDEFLLVEGAYDRKLQRVPEVARTLIMLHRQTMIEAMRNVGLLKGQEPTEEEVREYYLANRDTYELPGALHARHIQCSSAEQAQQAYAEVMADAPARRTQAFYSAVQTFSENAETKRRDGDLGWFNPNGVVKAIQNSQEFSAAVWDFELGVNPPLQIGSDWHIVDIITKQFPRPMTFEEAFDRARLELLPYWQLELITGYLNQARAETTIEYFGDFRPGQGKTARQLFERAFYVTEADEKIALYQLLVDDYPDSDLVDDALFLIGNLFLDGWSNQLSARRYLNEMVERFPDSEYVEDARYILDNMGRPGFRNPKNIEDLRRQ